MASPTAPGPRQRLFAPGPTPIPDPVQAALAEPPVYHRGPAFPELLTGVLEDVKSVFPTTHDLLALASSGTGVMEAAVVNTLSSGERALAIQAGQFGARWGELCRAYGIDVDIIDLPWGSALDPAAVASHLGEDPSIRVVFATQSETSTGVLHDIQGLGEAVRDSDRLLVIDGISSVGAHPLSTDEWGVDVAVTASQKGLMLPPGLGIIAVGPRAWESSERADLPRYYWDLRTYRASLAEGRGPATLPVTLIAGFRAALDLIAEEGIEQVWARHARHAGAVRAAADALGLSVFAQCPSNALTAIALPEQVDGLALMEHLRVRFGIILGGGLAHLRGRIVRISNLGYVDDLDILSVVSALEVGLMHLAWPFHTGTGVAAAEDALFKKP
ncbi:MAG: alanine--glyoxylate aminotransferase family protein [Candidatus Latescibacteria bacterium]|nr:alanine--glyoxylate aminotransferase family protein [Candidatus Latescibacterota bacterium]